MEQGHGLRIQETRPRQKGLQKHRAFDNNHDFDIYRAASIAPSRHPEFWEHSIPTTVH